jgi:phage terminase Nu1 subunit (DNA packaging protein)
MTNYRETQIVTADELRQVLKVSLATIRAWQRQGLPYVPCGRLRRYVVADVLHWLQEREQQRNEHHRDANNA